MQENGKHGQRAQTQSRVAREPILLAERAAYSPAEFAAKFGRDPSWTYRLLYGGKIRALPDLGRILIPASELDRVLSTAAPYNPERRNPETKSPESSAMIGGRQ